MRGEERIRGRRGGDWWWDPPREAFPMQQPPARAQGLWCIDACGARVPAVEPVSYFALRLRAPRRLVLSPRRPRQTPCAAFAAASNDDQAICRDGGVQPGPRSVASTGGSVKTKTPPAPRSLRPSYGTTSSAHQHAARPGGSGGLAYASSAPRPPPATHRRHLVLQWRMRLSRPPSNTSSVAAPLLRHDSSGSLSRRREAMDGRVGRLATHS